MLTPQEIQDQKFEKAVFGGYDMGQIDKFLDAVLSDYTSLYKENAALKAKMRVLVDKIEEYRAVDEELRKTLYNAQIAAKDTVSRAQAEAERIVRDAQFAANRNVTDLQGKITAEEKRLEDDHPLPWADHGGYQSWRNRRAAAAAFGAGSDRRGYGLPRFGGSNL